MSRGGGAHTLLPPLGVPTLLAAASPGAPKPSGQHLLHPSSQQPWEQPPPIPGAAAHPHRLAEASPGCLHLGHCLPGCSCPLHTRRMHPRGPATPASWVLHPQVPAPLQQYSLHPWVPACPGASVPHIPTAASLIVCVPGASNPVSWVPASLGRSHPWGQRPRGQHPLHPDCCSPQRLYPWSGLSRHVLLHWRHREGGGVPLPLLHPAAAAQDSRDPPGPGCPQPG